MIAVMYPTSGDFDSEVIDPANKGNLGFFVMCFEGVPDEGIKAPHSSGTLRIAPVPLNG